MQYFLCNGSPRGTKGATSRIVDALAEEIAAASEDSQSTKEIAASNGTLNAKKTTAAPGAPSDAAPQVTTVLLNRVREHADFASTFAAADRAIIVFPLYTDGMPGITMAFIEALAPYSGRLQHMSIGYIVQSGFPEKLHSEAIAKYLKRLTEILGASYAGTLIFGGGMALYGGKRMALVRQLAQSFVRTGRFDPAILEKTTPMKKIGPFLRGLLRLFSKTPLLQFFWIQQLKSNGVYKKRFDRPYGE